MNNKETKQSWKYDTDRAVPYEDLVSIVKSVEKTRRRISPEEYKAFLCFLWYFGCRVNEALTMKGRHFRKTHNDEKGIDELAAKIPYSKWKDTPGSEYQITQKDALEQGRTRDRHTVYAKWNDDSYIFEKIVDYTLDKGQTEVVFGDEIECKRDYNRIYHRFWERLDILRKKLGVELEYHQFRHNRASKLAEEQQGTYVLQQFHGWQNPITAKNYVRRSGQIARSASDKIE